MALRGRIADVIAEAELPPMLADFTLESFPHYGDADALATSTALAEWLAEWKPEVMPRHWLLLTGEYGNGKTGRAIGTMKALVEKLGWECASAAFVVASDLVRDLYRSMKGDEDAAHRLDRYRDADVLVLDDVGADHTTEYVASAYYALLNHRLNHNKATIITTNLDPDALAEHFTERVMWRVVQALGGLENGMIVCRGINLHDPVAIATAERNAEGKRPNLKAVGGSRSKRG